MGVTQPIMAEWLFILALPSRKEAWEMSIVNSFIMALKLFFYQK